MPRKRPDNAQEWLDLYERKHQRAYDNYQQTGETRFDYQVEEYEVLCDALRALINKRVEMTDIWAKRRSNCEHVIDSINKSEYSRDEVVSFLRDAIYW
jgi:hypothetical protein